MVDSKATAESAPKLLIKKLFNKIGLDIRRLDQNAGASGGNGAGKNQAKNEVERLFQRQFQEFERLATDNRFELNWNERFPCLDDNTGMTPFDSHYVYHPAWAARIVRQINPKTHVDISSILQFCTILSAFVPVEFYDFRPANLTLDNLFSGKADLTNLHFETESIESLSCMHTIEHIGLGRYGDPLDPSGDIKAINEIKRVVRKNGSILFVTPVGKSKILFNAHRIYSPYYIL